MKTRIKKAGRRPVLGVERTESGQISRSNATREARLRARKAIQEETEREAMSTAVAARARHTRLPEELAKRDFAGSALGLLHFDRRLSTKQAVADAMLEAGKRYAIDMARYYALTGIPFPSARAFDMFRVAGFDGEMSQDHAKAARAASNKMMELEAALLQATDGPMVKRKTFEVCVLDLKESREWTTHTVGFLRRGLERLVDYYGIEI